MTKELADLVAGGKAKAFLQIERVNAIQWFPELKLEAVEFPFPGLPAGAAESKLKGRDVRLGECGRTRCQIVAPGDWVVYRSNGGIDVFTNDEFNWRFVDERRVMSVVEFEVKESMKPGTGVYV